MTIRMLILLVCLGLFQLTSVAQVNVSDNEIEGFRFSTQDRVKDLTLLVSSKDDVMALFGKDCVNGCNFNDDWDISFAYVNSGWSTTKMENGVKVVYKPKPEFLDKLTDINFSPKKAIVLPEPTYYPPGLKCDKAATGQGTLQFKSLVCTDQTLFYLIYDETDPDGKYQKNQIHHISYTRAAQLNEGIFAPVRAAVVP